MQNSQPHDSPRWCEECQAYGDHHTDRHLPVDDGEPAAR